jgi:hypothetical protein
MAVHIEERGNVMYFTIHRATVKVVAVGVLVAGLLSGCGEKIAEPPLPTSVDQVEQGLKEIGHKASEQFKKIVNGDLPLKEQLDKLAAESKDLYCKAESTEGAEAVKRAAQEAWDQLIKGDPNAPTRQLDLDPKMCSK